MRPISPRCAYGVAASIPVFIGPKSSGQVRPQADLCLEIAMPPDNRPSFARIIDLRMMLLFGRGHIRAEAELNKLFGALGLKASRVLSLPPSPNIIVEGRIE